MSLCIEYALLKEIPLPKLVSILESAKEEPPQEYVSDCERISMLLSKDENDKILRDVARLLVTTPAVTSSIVMKSPGVEKIVSMPAVSTAIDYLKMAGAGALLLAEQKAEQRNPLLSKFIKIFQEEMAARDR